MTACEVLDDDDPSTLTYLHNLGTALSKLGDMSRAVSILEQSLEANTRLHGEDHHSTLLAQNSLAGAYSSMGCSDQATYLYEKAYNTALRVLGEDHPHTRIIRRNLTHSDVSSDQPSRD